MKQTNDYKIIYPQQSEDLRWLDSRTSIPDPNSCNVYHVIFEEIGLLSVGMATFYPTDGYTNGEWKNVQCTNTNPRSQGKVLFWMQNPSFPEFLK